LKDEDSRLLSQRADGESESILNKGHLEDSAEQMKPPLEVYRANPSTHESRCIRLAGCMGSDALSIMCWQCLSG